MFVHLSKKVLRLQASRLSVMGLESKGSLETLLSLISLTMQLKLPTRWYNNVYSSRHCYLKSCTITNIFSYLMMSVTPTRI
jgi:hypothetical protein